MLTVAKVGARAAQGYAEYLEGKAQAPTLGDYYLKDGDRVEAPGRWVAGARALGLDPTSAVSGDQLRALMAVRHPVSGDPLRRAGGNREAVAAIDATFSAPKSVSAVWALGSPESRAAVERAHEEAVDRAVAYALRHVAMVRERVDAARVIHARAAEVIATSWRHSTARAVEGLPPDPQLHSHVVLHGAVRQDGRIVAIDSRSWFVHRREVGAAYRAELALELSRLGFGVERGTGRGGRYFELPGIPRELLDRWSSRHHEVRRAIEARLTETSADQLAPAEDRYMSRSTRSPKGGFETRGDLDRYWRDTARQYGVDGRAIDRMGTSREPAAAVDESELLARLTEFDATFADREARAVALETAAEAGIAAGLLALQGLRIDERVLNLADSRQTTRRHRAIEWETVGVGQRLASARVRRLPARPVEQEVSRLATTLRSDGFELLEEQREAIELACSDRQLVMIEGQAGTGKSTVLTAIARAHQDVGQEIIVTSTGALAAERLAGELLDAGVRAHSFSTVGLQAAISRGAVVLSPKVTVIHDEAALASTLEQQRLFRAVELSGARLIEVGDPRQSQAVGAGGLWPRLERSARSNEARLELSRNVRALDAEDRRDQRLFREGEHERALRGYAARERINVYDEQFRAEDAALEAADDDRRRGSRTLVIAQTSNDRLDELNARAQSIRQQRGELRGDGVPIPGRPYSLRAGDEIQIRHAFVHPRLGRIANGTAATVVRANASTNSVTLRLSDERAAVLDCVQLEEADVRLAYVQHPFPAQGRTSDTAYLIVAEHATAEGNYVAITRARGATNIYAARELVEVDGDGDEIGGLAERMSRSEREVPSIDTPLAHEHFVARALEASVAEETTPADELVLEPARPGRRVSARDELRSVAGRGAGEETELSDGLGWER